MIRRAAFDLSLTYHPGGGLYVRPHAQLVPFIDRSTVGPRSRPDSVLFGLAIGKEF